VNKPITVRNPLRIKALILAGLPGFAAAGIYLCVLSWQGGLALSVEGGLSAGLGAFLLVVAVKGWPLIHFINHTATVDSEGVLITQGDQSMRYGWEQLGEIETSDTFQVLGIRDRAGRLIYAVDYYAENFAGFVAGLREAWT